MSAPVKPRPRHARELPAVQRQQRADAWRLLDARVAAGDPVAETVAFEFIRAGVR